MAEDAMARHLAARIAAEGPIPVSDFMAEAVAAYYQRPQVFGAAGDFITAPEISQIFGELVGLWLAMRWLAAGRPERFVVAECGPGRGALMGDALRSMASVPGLRQALELHLVETSPMLRAEQARVLGTAVTGWHDTITTVPDGPVYWVANEFFDALPVRQWVFTRGQWCDRCITVAAGEFAFVSGAASSPEPELLHALPQPAEGDVLEDSPAAVAVAQQWCDRIVRWGGAALVFDYGYTASGFGDTVQAVSRHQYVPALTTPGAVDLTAHVNFDRLVQIGWAAGVAVAGPVTQGAWLLAMGARERVAQLCRTATGEQARTLQSGLVRLVDPVAMGRLFKVLAWTQQAVGKPEGF